jgi:hypothetical protein
MGLSFLTIAASSSSRPLQPIRKDLMIRFRHDSSDGGDYGDAREVCEEICCAAER